MFALRRKAVLCNRQVIVSLRQPRVDFQGIGPQYGLLRWYFAVTRCASSSVLTASRVASTPACVATRLKYAFRTSEAIF